MSSFVKSGTTVNAVRSTSSCTTNVKNIFALSVKLQLSIQELKLCKKFDFQLSNAFSIRLFFTRVNSIFEVLK